MSFLCRPQDGMEPPNQRCGYPSLLRARSCQDDLPQSGKLRVADKTTRTFWATSLKPASELYGHIHAKARSIVSRCQKSKTLHPHSGKTRALRRPPWLVGYANHSSARVYFAENSRVRLRATVLLASVPRFFRTTDIVVAVEQGNRGAPLLKTLIQYSLDPKLASIEGCGSASGELPHLPRVGR